MKLATLATKPQLIEVVLDDADTISEYGEPLSFHTWDRQPLDIFMRLAISQSQDPKEMLEIVRQLLLDENGKAIVTADTMLPTAVLIRAIAKLTETLGK